MMTVECVGEAFTYRWPGGEVRLEPGKPIDLPVDRAQRLLAKAPDRVRVVQRLIQAGDAITWQRADGSTPCAVVDFVHLDETGTCWGFVTLGAGWAAINTKFVRVVERP